MSYSETTAFSDGDLLILFQPQNSDTRVGKASTLLSYIQENFDTGVLETKGTWRGEWVTGTNYYKNDIFSVETEASIYIVLEAHQSTSVANDVTFGRIESMVTGTVIADPQIADGTVTAIKIAAGAVTKDKIEDLTNLTVLGNVSGVAAAPQEVSILDEDDMASDSDTALATQQSIKAYFDDNRELQPNEITAANIPNGEIPIEKIETLADMTVIGNNSGSIATPTEVNIIADDTLQSGSPNDLVRRQSIKSYVDSVDLQYVVLTGGTNALTKTNTTATIVYNIQDFTGVGLVASKIRQIHLKFAYAIKGQVSLFYTDPIGVERKMLTGFVGGGSSDGDVHISDIIYTIPVNAGQESFSLRMSSTSGGANYAIIAATQITATS